MYVALSTILGLILALSGSSKLQRKPMAVAAAEKLKYTNIMIQIGAAELLLGVLAVTGNYFAFIPDVVARAAVFGMTVIMAGAVMFHAKEKDYKGAIVPLVLCVLGAIALGAN